MSFTPAIRKKAKLKLALSGPPGAGKTLSALRMATALASKDGKIAVIDTEHGSASLYVGSKHPEGVLRYDSMELANFHPKHYIQGIHDAVAGGYKVLVIDSLSHAWNGLGGMLEMADNGDSRNKFANWKPVDKAYRNLIETILAAPLHVIVTTRSKMGYVEKDGPRGKTYEKTGMAPVMRDGIEYEFTVFGEMSLDNSVVFSKTRCQALSGLHFQKPGGDVIKILNEWLETGEVEDDRKMPAQDDYSGEGRSAYAATNAEPRREPEAEESRQAQGNGSGSSTKVTSMLEALDKCPNRAVLDKLTSSITTWSKEESVLVKSAWKAANTRLPAAPKPAGA